MPPSRASSGSWPEGEHDRVRRSTETTRAARRRRRSAHRDWRKVRRTSRTELDRRPERRGHHRRAAVMIPKRETRVPKVRLSPAPQRRAAVGPSQPSSTTSVAWISCIGQVRKHQRPGERRASPGARRSRCARVAPAEMATAASMARALAARDGYQSRFGRSQRSGAVEIDAAPACVILQLVAADAGDAEILAVAVAEVEAGHGRGRQASRNSRSA